MSTLNDLIKQSGIKEISQEAPVVSPNPTITPTPTPDPDPDPDPNPNPTLEPNPSKSSSNPPPPQPEVDKLKIIGESFGKEFKTEEEFTAWKDTLNVLPSKISEYEARVAALETEKEALAKSFEPRSLFASDELFVLNGLLKKFPDKNPVVLTEISTKDFSKSYMESPIDVLSLDLMLEHPGIYTSKAQAEEDILERYHIDERDENDQLIISDKVKRIMQVDAKAAVEKFNGVKKQIEIPPSIDRAAEKAAKELKEQERITKITAATETLFTKTIPSTLKEVEFPMIIKGEDGKEVAEIAFKYDIGDGYAKSKAVQEILASLRNGIIQKDSEWTPEKEAQVGKDTEKLLKALYLFENREKVYAAISTDLLTKYKDEAWMKRHHPRPLRQEGTIPIPNSVDEKNERQRNDQLRKWGIKVP